ncbi:tripartite tricarboxylate transporter TctB family protein [Variovorax dokdonensis]|uniref:Tripartite tricarboxylate transporter TctB family protein n=1 Tax=Variovorax dokdonensis TaxID=344883 RepID=A0ABT7N7K9_9BURK|nr:tripartite tricarboxylate transporter TctB family protein [Variovorax dokdonensis]MDM0043928.1 tripartite tricarboxylate transporter TctB family protein [Variovorax dokdonensis]
MTDNAAPSDRIAGLGWIVFGALLLAESLRMDRFEGQQAALFTLPGFMPGLLGAVLMVLGLLHVLRGRPSGRSAAERTGQPAERLLNGRALVTLVLSVGYAAGMVGHMPYALCTAIYVAAFVAIFAAPGTSIQRRLLVGAIAGVATAAAVTVVFEHLFLVRLP